MIEFSIPYSKTKVVFAGGHRSFYIVIAQMNNGEWAPAEFFGKGFSSCYYRRALEIRKNILEYVEKTRLNHLWTKERIKIVKINL